MPEMVEIPVPMRPTEIPTVLHLPWQPE